MTQQYVCCPQAPASVSLPCCYQTWVLSLMWLTLLLKVRRDENWLSFIIFQFLLDLHMSGRYIYQRCRADNWERSPPTGGPWVRIPDLDRVDFVVFSSLLRRFSPRFPCSPPSTKTNTHPRLSLTLLFSCFYCVLNFRRGTICCNIVYYCNTCFDYTARVDQNYARRSVQRSWEIFLVCFNEVERQLFHALIVCSYNHEKSLYLMSFVLLCRFNVYFALKR